ncbi:hypothetical protein B0A48_06752 [Cryoendolithus antarcticus]|uniref:Uncharacterized protein n=1 Tax=Cryoendolithus antarcticus TaxID=1507870 RepID=A0A1V8T9D5_9PEZI|nr:hypothetical protein B0A48_06752 [Cryoendolithus antarcticus]
MVGKKSGRALLREEGLQRTDNNMEFSTWPQVNMINQKNYYTEFLKRDDQVLALRLQHDERLDRRKKAAVDIDRARAQGAADGVPFVEPDPELDEDDAMDDIDSENFGSKTIIFHPGSANLRVGLATDAIPKTVPMVIARKSQHTESELSEPLPKRQKLSKEGATEELFGEDFATQYNTMATDFRTFRRSNKRRVLPNSRELVQKWNTAVPADIISEHNDRVHVEWTELPADRKQAPEYIVGDAALRIPERSSPKYRLYWPMRYGWLNEEDYTTRNMVIRDFFLILEESIKTELGLRNRREWSQYSAVFVIPDLYEKVFVAEMLRQAIVEFGFQRVCFIQESVAATFGAGYGISCVVDMGHMKTGIACVEDGMVIEESRINLKYGGADVTDTFVRMMLFDKFNYQELNLLRRHDMLLAKELRETYGTMSDENISVQQHTMYVRAHGEQTRKYDFKLYDEGMLAPLGYFRPAIFDHTDKLNARRKLIPRSTDLYDGRPNDPMSPAQLAVLDYAIKNIPSAVTATPVKPARPLPTPMSISTPSKARLLGLPPHMNGNGDTTPASSVAGSPPPEDMGTPQPGDATESSDPTLPDTDALDLVVPIMPLHSAILTSIEHASGLDERRRRDLLGSIMLIGGMSKTPAFHTYLEAQLRAAMPQYPKEILVARPPKELDPEILVWKGGSVFGGLRVTNDSWIGGVEWDRLGGRILNYKVLWHW